MEISNSNTLIDKSILLHYKTMRKCIVCREYITIEEEWVLGSIFHYKDGTKTNQGIYHKKCLVGFLRKKKYKNVDIADESIFEEIEDKVKDSDLEIYNLVCKNHLYKYLMSHYDVVMFSSGIYTKMEQIFTGEWRNMSKPIPPHHLLEMFERQAKYLDGIYHKERLNGVQRIQYDLAVLIAKYNGFLDWKEKAKEQIESAQSFVDDKKPDIKIINSANILRQKISIFADLEGD